MSCAEGGVNARLSGEAWKELWNCAPSPPKGGGKLVREVAWGDKYGEAGIY